MNRLKTHSSLVGFLFFMLFSLPNYATTAVALHSNLADSLQLYATHTTATVPDIVTIDVKVGNFKDINEFVFSMQWDPTKLQLQTVDNISVGELLNTVINTSDMALGKAHFAWSGSPLTLPDSTVIFQLHFKVPTYYSSPAYINFIDDSPLFETYFKNSLNVIVPMAGNYGQVDMLPTISCNSREPGLTCQTAPLLCPNEFPYCSKNNSTSVQTSPGNAVCFSLDVNNNVWLAFMAGSDSIDFKIKTSNCNGGQGIQAAVIASDDCINFTALNPVACNRDIRQDDIKVLECRNLTVGKVYYIMVDGYAFGGIGAICDFSIFITKGRVMTQPLSSAAITGSSSVCANQSNISFTVPTQTNAQSYEWKIANSAAATISSGNGTPSVNVAWGNISDSVCVRVISRCETTPWVCKSVAVGTQSHRDTVVYKCSSDSYFFNGTNLTAEGTYMATFTSLTGCDSVVKLTLTNYPPSVHTLDRTICIGSSVQVGTHTYTTSGTYTDTFVKGSFKGCDSVVILNLTVLSSSLDLQKSNDLSCALQSAVLSSTHTQDPNSSTATYEWTSPDGQVIGTSPTLTVTQAGVYKLKLTITYNGISCSQDRPITVNRTGTVPSKPGLSGVTQSCFGQTEIFNINNPQAGLTYNWSVVGGVSSGGTANQISVNWNTGISSAKICVNAEDICGKSDSICKSVDVAVTPSPLSIAGSAETCPNSTITYSVPLSANISTYQWRITNGTISKGQGTNSIDVTWGTTTTGKVCVTPANRCGAATQSCLDVVIKSVQPDSLPILGNASFCSIDTSVFTNASTIAGNQFVWDVPTGATILRGQGTNTILVVWGTALGNKVVGLTLINSCNLSRKVTLNVNIKNAALAIPSIAGSSRVCPMSRSTYTIPVDASITSYLWSVPTGASIVSGGKTNSVLVDWGASSGGSVCLEIKNNCNVKKSACLPVEVKATLDSLTITGVNSVCKDSIAVFEVQNDPNASAYFWFIPANATIFSGRNTSKVEVKFASTGGIVGVVPVGGCADGQPSRIPISIKLPPSAPLSIAGVTSICEGGTSDFSIATIPDVRGYQWKLPVGAYIEGDSTSNQVTVNMGTSHGGQLCARGVNDCGAGNWACTTLNIINKPTVNAGNDTSICGTRITLNGYSTASTQTWSILNKPVGANEYIANSGNAQADVKVSKPGIYTFKLESSNATGCTASDSINVEFKELPVLTLGAESCDLDATQYHVQLSITSSAQSFSMLGSTNGVLTGNSFLSNPIVNGAAYHFTVKDNLGCISNEIAGQKTCPCISKSGSLKSDSLIVCYGLSGVAKHLNDSNLDGNDTYEFILYDGTATQRTTILKRNKTGVFDATSLQYNHVYFISYTVGDSLANGSVDFSKACTSTSRSIPIVFKDKLTASLQGDTVICHNSNAELSFNVNQQGLFNITLREALGQRHVYQAFSSQQITVNPSVSTTYILLEVKDKNGCQADLTDSATVKLKPLPISNAGVDTSVCNAHLNLNASDNLQYAGKWSTLTNNVRILTPNDPKSGVQNLQNGKNVFIWAVADTTCPNYTVRDTVQIFLPLLPKANNLSLITTVGQPVKGNAGENAPTGTYSVTRLTNPASGNFEIFSNGSFTYIPDTIFTGIVKFKFAICSDLCTGLCDTGEVRILINPKLKDTTTIAILDVPNAITPNGDGKNDVLIIDGIEQYPDNELLIFNRWGNILYHAKPYLNDWQGVNQSGGELPEGTYYYVLRLNVNDGKVLKGNMTILR